MSVKKLVAYVQL